MTFPATRAEALERLDAFMPRAGLAYTRCRNLDEGPAARTTVSGLSPAIRRRLITEEEVARAAVAAQGFEAAQKFVMEVCWRTYWRGWLEAHPHVWRRYLAGVERQERALGDDPALAVRYAEAVAGRTGIDCQDFWARELVETGYLHNHARMSFASIWIFTLRLPWELGAAHFHRHLLDACPASNTLSWRWVAGLQTLGKPYLAIADAIRQRSGGRFRVNAALATAATGVPPEPMAATLPLPQVAAADPQLRSGIFLHTEDLSAETSEPGARVHAVAAATRIDGDPADLKRNYADAALADGLARYAKHAGLPAERLSVDDLPEVIGAWAARHRLTQLLTPYAPVGPVADRLVPMADTLARQGVRLVQVRRDWDSRAWPNATRGFFRFRDHIPGLLS